ncbi:MAG: cytochrome P450 [Maricaulaceae bacterium]
MARHNYKFRPKPRFEGGEFIPPAPTPVEGHPQNWTITEHIRSAVALSQNPIQATTRITRQMPYVKATLAGSTLIVMSDPKMIKYVFVENADNYRLNPIRQAILRPILKDGLISAEDSIWKRTRRALSPLFTPRHTKGFAQTMHIIALDLLPKIFANEGDILLSDHMLKLAYLVLSETLFSGEIDEDIDQVLRDTSNLLIALGKPDPLDIFNAPKWMPRVMRLRGHGSVRRMRRMILELIEKRRACLLAGEDIPDDFLTLLLRTTDDNGECLNDFEIEDQILTFVGAGHETTSRAMTWMFYLLSQDTNARDRLETEVDALDTSQPPETWADHLPWTMACFEETMRLYPPAPIISRQAIEPDSYGDALIEKDCNIMVNLWALHRHENLWAEPDHFRPERFLSPAREKIDRFQYLPFGMGKRVCIGQRFAMQEAAILIALTARKYRFDYAGKTPPWPIMRITVQADNKMPMTVTKRR